MGYDELGIVLSNAILSDFDKKIKELNESE